MEAELGAVDLTANHNGEIIGIAVVFSLLSLSAMVARLASRCITKASFGADDALLIASWTIAFAETVTIAAATQFAKLGYHMQALSADDIVALGKVTYATSFLQSTTLALSKLSILVLFHRIFVVPRFRMTVYILSGIVVAWWAVAFFAGAFICFPASRLWDPNSGGSCGNAMLLNIIEPIPWVLTDFAILIAPIPVVRKLQLSKAKKWSIYVVFGLGGATCIISIVRYVELVSVKPDISWTSTGLACLQIVEAHVSIACAALIAAKPALSHLVPSKLGSSFQSLASSHSRDPRSPSFNSLRSSTSSEKIGISSPKSMYPDLAAPRIMVEQSLERTVESVRTPMESVESMERRMYS